MVDFKLFIHKNRVYQMPSSTGNDPFAGIIGNDPALLKVKDLAKKAARADIPVLITGESGTGKGLLSKAIHYSSDRCQGPLMTINSAGIPEPLLESELFGHAKGTFTDAIAERTGLLVLADHGTVFLDEIGDMSPQAQAKVLKVLEEKEVTPLGKSRPFKTDFRLICATNKDLKKCVEDGTFRHDLYFRINVLNITMPPLRARKDDILLLAHHLLRVLSKNDRSTPRLSANAASILVQHSWPGNVRELENVCERALVLSEGDTITPFHLPEDIASLEESFLNVATGGIKPIQDLLDLRFTFEKTKAELIKEAWERCGGNVSQIARILDANRGTITKKVVELGLRTKNSKSA